MYNSEFIKKELGCNSSEALDKYIKICQFYQEHPTKIIRSQYHHIIPVFITRINKNLKNRIQAEQLHDEIYNPQDNVVLLPGKYHLLAHYYLGKAMRTKEAINSFQIFIGDYIESIENYTENQVKELGQMYEDTCQPNKFKQYLTYKEKENFYKNLTENQKN